MPSIEHVDVRVVQRYLQKGAISPAEYQRYLDGLPDGEANAVYLDYDLILRDEFDEAPSPVAGTTGSFPSSGAAPSSTPQSVPPAAPSSLGAGTAPVLGTSSGQPVLGVPPSFSTTPVRPALVSRPLSLGVSPSTSMPPRSSEAGMVGMAHGPVSSSSTAPHAATARDVSESSASSTHPIQAAPSTQAAPSQAAPSTQAAPGQIDQGDVTIDPRSHRQVEEKTEGGVDAAAPSHRPTGGGST